MEFPTGSGSRVWQRSQKMVGVLENVREGEKGIKIIWMDGKNLNW